MSHQRYIELFGKYSNAKSLKDQIHKAEHLLSEAKEIGYSGIDSVKDVKNFVLKTAKQYDIELKNRSWSGYRNAIIAIKEARSHPPPRPPRPYPYKKPAPPVPPRPNRILPVKVKPKRGRPPLLRSKEELDRMNLERVHRWRLKHKEQSISTD